MDLLIETRKSLKGKKLWEEADRIRDGLDRLGISIKDTKDGTVWRKS
jgi:cysteinyl-tRNA synthetase